MNQTLSLYLLSLPKSIQFRYFIALVLLARTIIYQITYFFFFFAHSHKSRVIRKLVVQVFCKWGCCISNFLLDISIRSCYYVIAVLLLMLMMLLLCGRVSCRRLSNHNFTHSCHVLSSNFGLVCNLILCFC